MRRHGTIPWRVPIATEELEPGPTMPLPVGPLVLWQSAMITKYDLVLIEFSRDGTNWTILQRSKHYSASRMFFESVRFIIIVTDPRNESTLEIIKVTRDVTEATPLSYQARAPTSWLDQASCIEADEVTGVANATTTEEIVGRCSR